MTDVPIPPADGVATSAVKPARLSTAVWALGLTSLFMDISSEMIHSLLPVVLVVGLGTTAAYLGVIEGVAEATTCIVKVFSGALSDYFGRRKPLALLGYGMAALTKPLFPLASSAGMVFFARFIDRVGKGIRGAPRDALVADVTPPEQRGAAFGLRQSLDTIGAFAGPVLAMLLAAIFAGALRTVLWVAVLPAFVSVVVLWVGVREPKRQPAPQSKRRSVELRVGAMPQSFWIICAVASVFMLSRFSEAFLVLVGIHAGLTPAMTPLALVAMNLAYLLSAYPVGTLSDRMPKQYLLVVGCGILAVANGVLAVASNPVLLIVGALLWGLHMGFTEGVFAAMVANSAPKDLRGSAFGIFNLLRGLVLLAASVIAGLLWDQVGPQATFGFASVLALLTVVGLWLSRHYWQQASAVA
ncbi:MAG: transporter [Gammaproteobacteria bacterium]|nr:transporter [Gammaproteobacteria bacterium]